MVRTLAAISCPLLVAPYVYGRIEPSFRLEESAWQASDVVLLETTVNDAEFIVTESWRGNLRVGELIEVHGLEPQDGAIAISERTADPYGRLLLPVLAAPQVPRQPVGSQLLLLMKRDPPRDRGKPPACGMT